MKPLVGFIAGMLLRAAEIKEWVWDKADSAAWTGQGLGGKCLFLVVRLIQILVLTAILIVVIYNANDSFPDER